ncbi:hypothetical protein CsSME_00010642 [Camellia sinensis var. sinensis]
MRLCFSFESLRGKKFKFQLMLVYMKDLLVRTAPRLQKGGPMHKGPAKVGYWEVKMFAPLLTFL